MESFLIRKNSFLSFIYAYVVGTNLFRYTLNLRVAFEPLLLYLEVWTLNKEQSRWASYDSYSIGWGAAGHA